MEMNENATVEELGKVIVARVGSDRNAQEKLLTHILKAMVAEQSRGTVKPSDDMDVFDALGVDDRYEAMKKVGNKTVYSGIAKLLLDEPSHGWDMIRLTVKNHIQEKINQDKMIQKEAGV